MSDTLSAARRLVLAINLDCFNHWALASAGVCFYTTADTEIMEKYIATPTDTESIGWHSDGPTPDVAYAEFLSSGQAEDYADYYSIDDEGEFEVYIYTWVTPEESDIPEEELEPHWSWVLNEKVETRMCKLVDLKAQS